ncbi:MAG: hypothetical protein IJD22_08215 [Clostridia bacterium]|nr:hypothetical protein [Clostridia bacterium]
MREFIEKKIQTEKIMRFVLIALAVTAMAVITIGASTDNSSLLAIGFICFVPVWIIAAIYFSRVLPFRLCISRLRKNGVEYVTDDININTAAVPKSKIYCGSLAFYSKKANVIIPYSDVLWAHMYEQRVNGITVEKSCIFYCKGGKKYAVPSTPEEAQWLISQYIIYHSPDLIIGYGKEQQEKYFSRDTAAAKKSTTSNIIWGIILLVMAALLTVVAVTGDSVQPMGIIVLIVLYGAGLLLVLSNKIFKKKDK